MRRRSCGRSPRRGPRPLRRAISGAATVAPRACPQRSCEASRRSTFIGVGRRSRGQHRYGNRRQGEIDTVDRTSRRAFTHPVLGLLAFIGSMAGLFWTLFALASVPMDLIEAHFAGSVDWSARCCQQGRFAISRRRHHRRHRRHGRLPAADLPAVLPDQPARRHRLSRARRVRDGPRAVAGSDCRVTRSCRCSRRTRARFPAS